MSHQVMNPHLVTNHQDKERKMEDLIIELCKNNVCTYLTKMQDMQNENDSLQRNGIKYYKQRFLTLTFDDMGKTAGDLFIDVNIQRSGWVKNPLDFNNCAVY